MSDTYYAVTFVTKTCRPVGCRPVSMSPSWFVTQMSVDSTVRLCAYKLMIKQVLQLSTLAAPLFMLTCLHCGMQHCVDRNSVSFSSLHNHCDTTLTADCRQWSSLSLCDSQLSAVCRSVPLKQLPALNTSATISISLSHMCFRCKQLVITSSSLHSAQNHITTTPPYDRSGDKVNTNITQQQLI